VLATRIAPFAIALILLTTACAKAPEAPPAPPSASTQPTTSAAPTSAPAKATAPAAAAVATAAPSPAAIPRGGELIVGKDQEAPGIDPARNPASAAIRIFDLMYSRLIRLDDQMRPVPDLAEKWEQPDGKTFIFHLRQGVRFHNGRELTSEDVKYTYERILNPDTGSIGRSFFLPIDTMETPDKYTFKVNLKAPFTPFLVNTSASWAGIVAKEIVEANKGDLNKVEAGSGPYMLQEWSPENRTVLVRNPNYYIPGQPYLDKITYLLMKEESARIAALRTGKIDWTILTAAGMDTLKKDSSNLTLVSGPTLGYYYLGMNVAKKPFDNLKVRQAISYAVDRKEIIDTVFRGYARLTGPVPAAMADWALDVSNNPYYKPDLNKAKQLMAEAGVTSVKTTIQAMSAQPAQVEAAQVIQSQLKKIGIEAEIQPLETGVYVDNWGKKNMELMVGGNTAGTNPDRAVSFFFSTKGSANVWNFSDARVDEIAAQASTLTDQAQAKKLYDEAQQRIVEMAPNLFLANQDDFVAYLPKVKGYKTMPDQTWGYLAQTYLQP
jgi:peptide/nickel transport system substrate-binding protein